MFIVKEKDRFKVSEFVNSNELIDTRAKITTLNIISSKLKTLRSTANPRSNLLLAIGTLETLINDAYTISMYRFQFKIFTISLNKEIEIIEKAINAENNK